MADLGLRLASDRDIIDGHALARRLVGPRITSAAALLAVQHRSGCASFVGRDDDGALVAAVSLIPLGPAAAASLSAGRFDGIDPPPAFVARPGDRVIAQYGWGMAGVTPRARATVIRAALKLQRDVYGDVPFYSRAATSEGERILHNRLGALPLPGSDGLVFAPAWAQRRRAA